MAVDKTVQKYALNYWGGRPEVTKLGPAVVFHGVILQNFLTTSDLKGDMRTGSGMVCNLDTLL